MSDQRKLAFVLAATDHGTMIVNRFDQANNPRNGAPFGIGWSLLEEGSISRYEIGVMHHLLQERRKHFGDWVLMLDCGANIGTHTVTLANAMNSWGSVIAFEPQEWVYYALTGNIALNNCFNAKAFCTAIGGENGMINVPRLNFMAAGSYGSLELRETPHNEPIGQTVDYRSNTSSVRMTTIDSLGLKRLDLLKLDIEGMEMEALAGAEKTIEQYHPALVVEWLKIDKDKLASFLEDRGYSWIPLGLNLFAVHSSDPTCDLLPSMAPPTGTG